MTSYLKYKAQIAVCDADDDIESWITVRGNHIPIKKGQSKEEAVKSFIEHQAGKNDTPQGVKWTPTNKKGEGTGNKKSEEKPKYNIQHGAKISDIESMINKHADKKGYKSWKEEEEYVAEKLKEEGIYAYGKQIKEAMKNVYGEAYPHEINREIHKIQTRMKNVGIKRGAKLQFPDGSIQEVELTISDLVDLKKDGKIDTHTFAKLESGIKKGEIKVLPESKYAPEFEDLKKELAKYGGERNLGLLGMSEVEKRGLSREYNSMIQESKGLKNAIKKERDLDKRNKLQEQLKDLENNIGKNREETAKIIGTAQKVWEKGKQESKYDPEFEVVRKNALANGNVYGGKYTQKSKAEAYKEYKNDTSSKENMKKANEFVNGKPEKRELNKEIHDIQKRMAAVGIKRGAKLQFPDGSVQEVNLTISDLVDTKKDGKTITHTFGKLESGIKNGEIKVVNSDYEKSKSDSPMVNAVAKALGKSEKEAESEINGAVRYIKDLMKSNDLRNGDVEETLRGLGIESDYAEEFMQWVSHPAKKKSAPKVTHVDKKAWNSPATDPWKSLFDSADTKKRWSADWKK